MKMSIEVKLIEEIEKHECLYNCNLPEYNRKDILEETWSGVAANCDLSVHECKDKWKNIRSSFVRSLKNSAKKQKKPYYLTNYLQFITPYLKPLSSHDINSDDQLHPELEANENTSESEICLTNIKVEPLLTEFDCDPIDFGNAVGMSTEEIAIDNPKNTRSAMQRANRRRHLTSSMKYKRRTAMDNKSMKYFLMSLLPEFDTMNEEQIRLFKIKVMMLIDEIKTDSSQMKQNLQFNSNNDRIQKRLINLLLKNLERT